MLAASTSLQAVSTSPQAVSTSLLQGVTVRRGPNAVRVRDRGRTRFRNQNRKVRATMIRCPDCFGRYYAASLKTSSDSEVFRKLVNPGLPETQSLPWHASQPSHLS